MRNSLGLFRTKTMQEIWKTVQACKAYEVSSLGRIRRILPGKRTKVGNIIRSEANTKYRTATLVFEGIRHYVQIHVLVCETFHGQKPSPNHQAAHLNGDKHDNRAENLCWATVAENHAHKNLHGTTRRGENGTGAKLTAADVAAIRNSFQSGKTKYVHVARAYGVHLTTIKRIVTRATWFD
jgi:hypothetical protein